MLNRRNQALALRREGLSASDIAQRIGVPLSTVGDWIRSVELTSEQKAAPIQRHTLPDGRGIHKPGAREEARRLRQQGMAIKRIAKQLSVSQSSVSIWVRDIVLSDEQMAALKLAQHTYNPGPHKGSQ